MTEFIELIDDLESVIIEISENFYISIEDDGVNLTPIQIKQLKEFLNQIEL